MLQDPALYQVLLQRYLNNDIGSDDLQLLFDFIEHNPEGAQQLITEADRIAFTEKLEAQHVLPANLTHRMHNRLLDDISKQQDFVAEERTATPVRAIKSIRAIRWWAAAAVLIIGFSSVYFYQGKKAAPAVVKNEPAIVNDKAPGTTAAVLTLANGQTIILDSNFNGTLAQQGGTQIIKTNQGIAYQPNGGDATTLFNTLNTNKGQMFPLVLSDGSKVWLNAVSAIRFPVAFSANERTVEVSGEVYFEVAHNAKAPFTVKKMGSDLQVQVLGTHFNVNTYEDEGEDKITLLEGSVKIKQGVIDGLLKPGQQAQLKDGSLKMKSNVDVDEVMAWKNGYISFNQADLATVLRQIARWYNVEVAYEGKIPNMKFGGGIARNSNLSQVLKVLGESNIRFRLEGNKIIVQSK